MVIHDLPKIVPPADPEYHAPVVVCPSCRQGTMLLYPIVDKAGNISGHERRCSFCHRREGSVQ